MRSTIHITLLIGASLGAVGQANAQTAAPPQTESAAPQNDRGFEDIIVTARRSSESLISVPVAVTALGGAELARYSSTDLSRVAQMIPQVSLQAGGEGGGGTFVVRGIGSTPDEAGIEQSVGIIIDGTPVGRGRILTSAMFDTQQIQVMKGPQALFFGKNSPAGVISVTSVDPVLGKFEGYARAGYEFRAAERYAEGAVSIPVGDTFALRLAGRVSKMDGWIKTSLAPAPDPNGAITGANPILPGAYFTGPDMRNIAGRVTALWQPTDTFKSKLKLQLGYYRDNGSQFETVCPGADHPLSAATGLVAYDNDCLLDRQRHATNMPEVYGQGVPYAWANGVPYSWVHSFVGSWSNDYDLTDGVTLSTITGYYRLKREGFANSNGSTFSEFSGGTTELTTNFSQEVRATTSLDGPLNFMVGGFYESNRRHQGSVIRLFSLSPDTRNGSYQTGFTAAYARSNTLSFFGQARWAILDNLELAGGARWTRERKTAETQNTFVSNGLTPGPFGPGGAIISVPLAQIALAPEGQVVARAFRGTNWSPEVTLTWHPTPSQTLYAAYKTGYKSGAIANPTVLTAANATQPLVVNPEKAKGGEIGYKAKLFDNTVRFELTGYYYKFSALQLSAFDAQSSSYFLLNAADATQKGVEGQIEWRATTELTLRAAAGYNSVKFGAFPNGACYAYQTAAQGCVNGVQDLSDRQLHRAPKFSASMGANYDMPIGGDLMLGFNTDARYTSSYFQQENFNPASFQKSYWLLNAGVRVYPENDRWEVAFIGRNLTNTNYLTYSSDGPGSGAGVLEAISNRGSELAIQGTVKF